MVVITRKVMHLKAMAALPTPPIQEGVHLPNLALPPQVIAIPQPPQQPQQPQPQQQPPSSACDSNPCKQGGQSLYFASFYLISLSTQ